MQPDINPYNEHDFREQFQHTEIYQQLVKDYDEISFKNTVKWDWAPTPRERLATARKSIFSAVSFYYLEYLTKHNPTEIYDLGCGGNFFKRYIPNIVGIGAEHPQDAYFRGDLHGRFNDAWVQQNQKRFHSIFAICSLHFIPFAQLRQRVLDLVSTMVPNGRAYLAFNTSRMIDRMQWHDPWPTDFVKYFDDRTPVSVAEQIIREHLSDMPFTYEVFDVNIAESGHGFQRYDYRPAFDNVIDGNIRMVIWNNKI